MAIGRFSAQPEYGNDQPWVESIRFWTGRKNPQALALSSAWAWLKTGSGPATEFTTVNGRVSISANVVTLSLSADDTTALVPGGYQLEIQVVDENGGYHQVRGTLSFVAGVR